MCFSDGDYPEFAVNRVVIARKVHTCAECGSAIESGEAYFYHTGKFDGSFYAEKQCRRCCYDTVRVVE
jgi:hypothetical protein